MKKISQDIKKSTFLFFFFFTTVSFIHAQLIITSGLNPTDYAQALVGPGVVISNVTVTVENNNQIGKFSNGETTNLGMGSGVVLSSGNVNSAPGNANTDASTDYSGAFGCGFLGLEPCPSNAPELSSLAGGNVFDAAILEFDFVPSGPIVTFDFVFASDEYPTYVGSFNDAFGIFLSGPGISGPYNGSANIATLPNGTPITINNVNDGNTCAGGNCTNCEYYVNNCNGTTIVYDGFTTVISVSADVSCGETYHIKFGVADALDGVLDTAVFIEAGSLTSGVEIVSNEISSDEDVICAGDQVTLDANTLGINTGTFEWQPGGETTQSITVTPMTTTEYTVTYTVGGCSVEDSFIINVENCGGCIPPTVTITDITICNGETANLNNAISNPTGNPTNTFYGSQADASSGTNPIANTVTTQGTYWMRAEDPNDPTCFNVYEIMITVEDCGCTSPTLDVTPITICDGSNSIDLNDAVTITSGPSTNTFHNSATDATNGTNPIDNIVTIEGSFWVRAENPTDATCFNIYEIVVTINSAPTFTISFEAPTCGNNDGSITIEGVSPSTTYTLTYANNGSTVGATNYTSDASGNILLANMGQGNYSDFILETNEGCTSTYNNAVILNPSDAPSVTAPNDIDICIGESVTLTAVNPDNADISWDNGVTDGVTFTPSDEGAITYTVSATVEGCTATDNVIVTVHGGPAINVGPDQFACKGESVTLEATGATEFIWDNNVVNGVSFVPPVGVTTYTVTGTDEFGCVGSTSITITVNENPEPSFVGENLFGCNPLTAVFTGQGANNGTCLWNFGDGTTGTGCNNVSHTYTTSGIYSVSLTVTDNIGCVGVYLETDYVEVIASPVASFEANPMIMTTMNTGVEFTNSSLNSNSYTWSFGDNSATSNEENPTHNYPNSESGDYIVTLIASNGTEICDDTLALLVKVEEELIFYIPNTFTPDKDDYNEIFKPIFTSGFEPQSYTMWIYNRWGEILFETHNTDVGWDGTYGAQTNVIVREGTYLWKIRFKEKGRDKFNEYMGHINLLK